MSPSSRNETPKDEPIQALLEAMTWQEFDDARSRGLCVLLPVGSTEQHGPHLPLGTDALIAAGLAERIAQNHPCVVAPPVVYGAFSHPRSGGGDRGFPGMVGVRGTTLVHVVEDVTVELFRHGFHKLVVLNGHFENHAFLYEALESAVERVDAKARVLLLNYWDLIRDEDIPRLFPNGFPGWEAEHAGVVETSLMETLRPDLVRRAMKGRGGASRTVTYDLFPTPAELIPPSGVGWSAEEASEEVGALLVRMLIERIVKALQDEGLLPSGRS